jgi:hypothetical protein
MNRICIVIAIVLIFTPLAFGKQFYGSDFEKDTIGKAPQGWELGFKGAGNGKVIADPLNKNNKIFAHTDLAQDKARHDVGGNVWVVGNADMTDYIVEYDAYFPTDFYEGIVFRFIDDKSFYLFDRRIVPPLTFDFYKHNAGAWALLKGGAAFPAKPELWFRFRIVVKGDTFEAYAKEQKDGTAFAKMKPLLSAQDGTYKAGKFGLYGLIYVDNVVLGETEGDMTIAVESAGKLTATWGSIKR